MRETPSQTAGPYLHIGMMDAVGRPILSADLRAGGLAGEPVTLAGRVTDGSGGAVADAVLEIWQADGNGAFPEGRGAAGRCACDEAGRYRFETVRPGPVAGQAPHVAMLLFARGVNRALHLRAYFEGDPANGADPVLRAAGARGRTLIARPDGGAWRLDICLQGEGETVFLDV